MATQANSCRRGIEWRDAEQLLDIVRGHYLAGTKMPAVWIPDVQTRNDREPVRARQDLSEKETRVKTQVQMLLKRHGLEKPEGTGKSWIKRYRQWLEAMSQNGGAIESGMRLVSKNPKKKKIAVVACMRRLAARLWHIGLQAQLRMEAAG